MRRMPYSFPTRSGHPPITLILLIIGVITTLILTQHTVEVDPAQFFANLGKMGDYLKSYWTVPEWKFLPTLLAALWQTVEMAVVATVIAFLFSIPIGILAARNTTPHPIVFYCTRALLSVTRAVPSVVIALLFVTAFGLGVLPGVLTLVLLTVVYMARFFADSLEVVDRKAVEGITALGASPIQVRTFAIFPQAFPDLLGTTLYALDSCVRSFELGVVGAGGIGYDLKTSMELFKFERLGLMMVGIYLTVTILDRLSAAFRSRVI